MDDENENDLRKIQDPAIRDLVRSIAETIGADDHQKRVAETQARESAARERARRQELADRGLPEKELAKILSGQLKPTRAIVAVDRWVEPGPKPRPTFLILSGDVGTGKTLAGAWAIARLDIGKLVHATDLFSWGRTRDESAARIHGLCNAGLLAIDDLGAEALDAAGRDLAILDRVVDARYANRRRTLITTNLAEKDFHERYGPRISRRIREAGAFIKIGPGGGAPGAPPPAQAAAPAGGAR